MTAGQVSDYTGAAALLDDLPKAQWLLGDRGYDADWFRDALQARASSPAARVGDLATSRSDTTSAVTGAAAASRSCSDASRPSVASPPAMTDARPSSSPPSPSQPPSYFGCDQRVLTLMTTSTDS